MNKIASVVTYHNYILIFMEDGRIYKAVSDDYSGFTYTLIDRFEPK